MARERFTQWVGGMIERAGGLRKAAREAGLNHATMLNISRGKDVDLATMEALAKWGKLPLSNLLDMYTGTIERDRLAEFEMTRLFTQYPDLRKVLAEAMEHLDDDDLRDVINFVQYKASQHKDRN